MVGSHLDLCSSCHVCVIIIFVTLYSFKKSTFDNTLEGNEIKLLELELFNIYSNAQICDSEYLLPLFSKIDEIIGIVIAARGDIM